MDCCFSVRLWNVPVATISDSDDSSDNSMKVWVLVLLVTCALNEYSVAFLPSWTNSIDTFSAIGGSRLEKCILVRSSREFFLGGRCDYSLLCYIVLVWSSFFVDLLCFCKLRLFCQFLIFRGVDHQWDGNLFATAGAQVDIWDHNRFQSPLSFLFPLNSFLK